MATVSELSPGDLVTNAGMSAVFITRMPHPVYSTLMLVVWRLDDTQGGGYSFDALDPRQEVGERTPSTPQERADRLRTALTGRSTPDA